MVFEKKKEEIKLTPDCKDFKPFLFDRGHCKLTSKCENANKEYFSHCYLKYPKLCTGINQERHNEWLKNKYRIPICDNMEEVYKLLKSPSDIDRVFIQSGKGSKILIRKE